MNMFITCSVFKCLIRIMAVHRLTIHTITINIKLMTTMWWKQQGNTELWCRLFQDPLVKATDNKFKDWGFYYTSHLRSLRNMRNLTFSHMRRAFGVSQARKQPMALKYLNYLISPPCSFLAWHEICSNCWWRWWRWATLNTNLPVFGILYHSSPQGTNLSTNIIT